MPALSSTMKEGKVVQWTKNVGDKISSGDVMMVVESDKADMDVEAFEEGYLAMIMTGEGEVAPVGAPVALLVMDKADIDSVVAPSAAGAPAAAAPAAAAPAAAAKAAPAAPAGGGAKGDRIVASPLAKAIATEKGIDISLVTGSGPGGRITSSDVENFKGAKGAAKSDHDVLAAAGKAPEAKKAPRASASTRAIPDLPDGPVPLSGMQVAVANNMDATLTIPSFRVTRKVETTKFDDLYAALKPKVSPLHLNPTPCYPSVALSAECYPSVALSAERYPVQNSELRVQGSEFRNINIANAVAIEGGLITPVMQNTNEMDIMSIASEWRELVGKAKSGTLKPAEYNSGTFMVSNLGMMGVSGFGALLPVGIGSILAVSASLPTVVMRKGMPTEVKVMELTITCDHRHIYGADAAQFLKTLAGILED
ncbi:2-oxoacid dehydrogenases acyltransferase-domain-containing protein, partial [Baffinella frigidus]